MGFLNKLVLFHVESYIQMTLDSKDPVPPHLMQLKLGIITYRKFNRFTQEEADIVLKFAENEELKEFMAAEVSFVVFSLELMKLWIAYVPKKQRPILGVSDKKFKLGGDTFWKQMLIAKEMSPEEYAQKKQIIKDSKEIAGKFFEFAKRISNEIKV